MAVISVVAYIIKAQLIHVNALAAALHNSINLGIKKEFHGIVFIVKLTCVKLT